MNPRRGLAAWAGRRASDRILKYYRYLFTFPSMEFMLLVIVLAPTLSIVASFYMLYGPGSLSYALSTALLGVIAPFLTSDLLAMLLLRSDPLLTPRRLTIVSYSSSLLYPLLPLISLLSLSTGRSDLPVRILLLLVALSSSLRSLVLLSLPPSPLRGAPSILLQPIASLLVIHRILHLGRLLLIYAFISTSIPMIAVALVVLIVSRGGRRALPLLRAFALAWAEGIGEPLEEEMDRIGETAILHIDVLHFLEDHQPKAVLVTPYIHPGPFREIGSSVLPRLISEAFQRRHGCLALISHGVSTHDRDLTTRAEVERAVETLVSHPPPAEHTAAITPPVRVVYHGASAVCQLFGDAALIILTLSPKSFDDLPDELRERLEEEASKRGLKAIVVDAHNSLKERAEVTDEDLENLYAAAVEAMDRALKAERRSFAFGVYRIIPREWSLEDGIGPCGISTLILRLEDGAAYAYIFLDGNNLKAGLRERILAAVRELDIAEGEVMTSDTHLVNALGLTPRGYYTIGEQIEESRLIEYVVEACRGALAEMKPGRVAYNRVTLREMRILGVGGLETFADILEHSFSLFRKASIALIPPSLLFSLLLLLLV